MAGTTTMLLKDRCNFWGNLSKMCFNCFAPSAHNNAHLLWF